MDVEFDVALAKSPEFCAELTEFCGVVDLAGVIAVLLTVVMRRRRKRGGGGEGAGGEE